MKIGMQTWGSRGDIRPFLALAEGLQSAGHEVTLAITCVDSADYNSSMSNAGVNIQCVASPVIRNKQDYRRIGAAIINETNPATQAKNIIALAFEPVEAQMYQASEQLCADNDLVIGHFFHYPLQTAAEKMGCPYISIMLQHNSIPSSLQPPVDFPNLGKFVNRVIWWIVKTVLNKALKPFSDKLRKAHGLSPARDLITDVWSSRLLTLVAVSPQICQRQIDWPAYYQVCGFLNLPHLSLEGQVPAELETFLAGGDAPVYMTFGSLLPDEPDLQKDAISLLTEAVRIVNCRAIIQAPLWRECGFTSSQSVYYIDAAPHAQVFPRCKAVIHHGGAGTTQSATLAGKPSIVVAHIAEQEFWGRELHRIGIAPHAHLRRKVSAEQLAKSIKLVIDSNEMGEKARNIAAAMKQEDGVAAAVELIQATFRK